MFSLVWAQEVAAKNHEFSLDHFQFFQRCLLSSCFIIDLSGMCRLTQNFEYQIFVLPQASPTNKNIRFSNQVLNTNSITALFSGKSSYLFKIKCAISKTQTQILGAQNLHYFLVAQIVGGQMYNLAHQLPSPPTFSSTIHLACYVPVNPN